MSETGWLPNRQLFHNWDWGRVAVIPPEQQMARRCWRQLPRSLAGLGKNPIKHPRTACSERLALNEFVIYAALV
jgi:hypothetical protein